MAKMAQAEETLWRQASVIKRLHEENIALQSILAVLIQRDPDQRVVITPYELMHLPSGTVIVRGDEPEGGMALWTHPKREDPRGDTA